MLLVLPPQMQRQVFTRCRPTLQRAAASRLVTVRAMASQAHNPGAITKKVFFDMEVGGNKAGAHWMAHTQANRGRSRQQCIGLQQRVAALTNNLRSGVANVTAGQTRFYAA